MPTPVCREAANEYEVWGGASEATSVALKTFDPVPNQLTARETAPILKINSLEFSTAGSACRWLSGLKAPSVTPRGEGGVIGVQCIAAPESIGAQGGPQTPMRPR